MTADEQTTEPGRYPSDKVPNRKIVALLAGEIRHLICAPRGERHEVRVAASIELAPEDFATLLTAR